MSWFKNIRFKWRRLKAMKKANANEAVIKPLHEPKQLFHIALSLTYKNVPMTNANVIIMHYAKDSATAKREVKEFAELKISGIKKVTPKK